MAGELSPRKGADGSDYEFYQTPDCREALIEAADSLVDRYDPKVSYTSRRTS